MEKKFGREAKAELENNGVDTSALVLDKEYKYNHVTCPAGEDTRNRLYVINKGGAVLYKCFNCGGSGHFRDRENWSPISSEQIDTMAADSFASNFNTRGDSNFTEESLLWLLGYEIDPDEFKSFFRQEKLSLNIAVMNGNECRGFQRRYFIGNIKYHTRIARDTYCHYLIGKEHPEVVFVVEDLLSSYKIWSLGYSVVALLGTTLKGHWPSELNNPKNVVVWLDNDTAGHAGAAKFVREMTLLFPYNIHTIFDRQPKEVPYAELTSICGVFK